MDVPGIHPFVGPPLHAGAAPEVNPAEVIQLLGDKNRLDAMETDHEDALEAYINFELLGKEIDNPGRYTKFVVAKCKLYFEKNKIENEREKLDLTLLALRSHQRFKIKDDVPLFARSIEAIEDANRYNEMTSGTRIHYPWWNFYCATKVSINPSENTGAGCVAYTRPNFWKYLAVASVTGMGLYFGSRLISRLCSTPPSGTIILTPEKLLSLLTSNDTAHKTLGHTAKGILEKSTDTLLDSSHGVVVGPVTGMFKGFFRAVGERCMNFT